MGFGGEDGGGVDAGVGEGLGEGEDGGVFGYCEAGRRAGYDVAEGADGHGGSVEVQGRLVAWCGRSLRVLELEGGGREGEGDEVGRVSRESGYEIHGLEEYLKSYLLYGPRSALFRDTLPSPPSPLSLFFNLRFLRT